MSNEGMEPVYARPLSEAERMQLRQALRATSGLTVRRAQMILKSADEGLKAAEIGRQLGCSDQTVREVIRAFHRDELACLAPQKRGRHDDQRAFGEAAQADLRQLIRRSPREFGHETSLWTLDLLAATSFEQGLVQTPISGETVRPPWRRWGSTGDARRNASPVPTHTMRAKKARRVAEAAG